MRGRRTLLCVAGLAMVSGCFEHPKIDGGLLECLDDDNCLPGYVCTRKATDPGEVWGHCVLPDALGFESADASKAEAGGREASASSDGTSGVDLRTTADGGGAGLDSVADGPGTSILPDGSVPDDAEGSVDGARPDDGATDGPGPATGGTSGSGGTGGSGGVRGTGDTGRDAGTDAVSGGATGGFDGGPGGGGAVAGTTGSAGASAAGATSSGGATTNSGGATTSSAGATASGGGGAGGTTTAGGSSGGASSSSSSSGPPPHLVPSTSDPVPLGEVATGESSSVASFTLTNTGPPTTGGINVASTSSEFIIQTGSAGDCASNAQLGTNQSCTVRVVLSPTTPGSKSALITFSTTPGNNGTVSVTGAATQGARLSTGSLTTLTFDGIAVSSTSPASTITVTNTGLRPTGVITVAPSGSDFTLLTNATDDCHSGTTVLAAGASCNLRLTFTPAAATGSTGTISVSATPGGTAGVSLLGCASDAHNGGDGTCVAKSTCSSGHHNSGTGHCVVNAPCPADQLTNDAGTCVPMAGVNWVNRSFSHEWQHVVSSADGLHLAVYGQMLDGSHSTNGLFVSNNFADSWQRVTTNYLYQPTWRTVTMSADGSTLNAWAWDYPTLYNNGSTDFGATWASKDYASYAIPITCTVGSADGAKLALGADMAQGIMTSSDFGANWETQALSPGHVTALAMSADGMKLVAGTASGGLAVSLDGGVNWTSLTSPTTQGWTSLASSTDGTKLVGVADRIYISSDSGGHWTAKEQIRTWSAVASSGDGAKLIASVNSGYLYLSSDSGSTWVPRGSSTTWTSVASSVDGTRLVAVGIAGSAGSNAGFVYTSTGPIP